MKKLLALIAMIALAGTLQAGDKAAKGKSTVKYAVKGMTCGGCEGKVKSTLTKLDGVTVDKVCSKSGSTAITFDEAKIKKEDLVKAINGTGFTVTGEQASFAVKGMTCGGCEGKVNSTLAKLDGVTADKVCSKSGSVNVTFDPAKATQEQIVAAINGTGFKVQK